MKSLDPLDKQILRILDSEGELSVSDVARKIRRGRDTVAYRMTRMEEQGILRGVEPIVDPSALGLSLFKIYLSFARRSAAIDKALEKLRNHPAVYCAARSFGRWDLIFNVAAPDVRHFAILRSEIASSIGAEVREMESAAFTEMIFYNRKYLGAEPRIWSTLTKEAEGHFDDAFLRVLRRVCLNARTTEVGIAEAEDLTPMVVRTRLAQARTGGVIVGYRARIDRTVFELSSYKLHIQLRSYATDVVSALRQFAAAHPYVSQFMQHIGCWPCEMNVEAHDNRHLALIIEELREKVGDAVGLVEISLYDRESFSWGAGLKKLRRPAAKESSDSLASAL
jgi:Lrp/AsnC family leucine-responsive transcriptional regulator